MCILLQNLSTGSSHALQFFNESIMNNEQQIQYGTCSKSLTGIAMTFKIAIASQLKIGDFLATARHLPKHFHYMKFTKYALI